MSIQSAVLGRIAKVQHFFGDLKHPIPVGNEINWNHAPTWKQVHGIEIAQLTQKNQDLGECDAMITCSPGLPLAIRTADCVPILLARKDGTQIGSIHAGWRGSLARIVAKFFEKVSDPENWVAAIGPAISGNAYEVDEDLILKFQREFSEHSAEMYLPKPRRLDLAALNHLELTRLGVTEVDQLGLCTLTTKQSDGAFRFASYRREPSIQLRQYSVITMVAT